MFGLDDWISKKLFDEEKSYRLKGWRHWIVIGLSTLILFAPLQVGMVHFLGEYPFECQDQDEYSWISVQCYNVKDVESKILPELSNSENAARLSQKTGVDRTDIKLVASKSNKYYCWTESTGFLASETYCSKS